MGIEKKDPANFSPSVEIPAKVDSFRFWCQKVLPLVYDDSLSYYELLCKVVNYLNNTIADVNTLGTDVDNLNNAYNELQSYVNDYFSTLDVQNEINNKLDVMAQDGSLSALIQPLFDTYKTGIDNAVNQQNNKINVLENRMNTFTSLPNGSTSGDAELIDIRVPANGFNDNKPYVSAGDAVRGQSGLLKEITSNLQYQSYDNIYDTTNIRNGYFIDDNGNISENDSTCFAIMPLVPNTDYILIRPHSNDYSINTGYFIFVNDKQEKISGDTFEKIATPMGIGIKFNSKNYVEIWFNVKLNAIGDNTNDTIMYNMNFVNKNIFPNIFSKVWIIDGGYIDDNGQLKPNSNTKYAKIPVKSDSWYCLCYPRTLSYSPLYLGRMQFLETNTGDIYSASLDDMEKIYTNSGELGIRFKTDKHTDYILINVKVGGMDYSDTLILTNSKEFVQNATINKFNGYEIETKKPFAGKKWVVMGDSITENNSTSLYRYYDYVSDELGLDIIVNGVSGSGYKAPMDSGNFENRIVSVNFDNADVITIFGSGNDLQHGYELGNITDNTEETICGCINLTIDRYLSKTNTNGCKLGIITPCPWGDYDPWTKPNNQMKLYSDAIVEICKNRGIPCLDLYSCSNMRPWNTDFVNKYYKRPNGITDTVHPNHLAHKEFIAPKVREFVKTLL